MALNESLQTIATLPETFSWAGYYVTIKPLLLFIVGVVIYSLFVFKFYRFLAKRDLLKLNVRHYYEEKSGFIKAFLYSIFYTLENLIVIPLLIFFWFAVLATLMSIISKTHTPELLLLTSATIVASVRVTSYYNENLSQDLAKMIPFALLGIFIVDMTYVSVNESFSIISSFPSLTTELIFYLAFAVSLEFVLRITHGIYSLFTNHEKKGTNKAENKATTDEKNK